MLPFASLDAATSPGPGTARDLETAVASHTIIVTATGSPSSVVVDFEGSHDSVNWFVLGSIGVAVSNASTYLIRYVRANLKTLTGGTAPTVTATIASKEG